MNLNYKYSALFILFANVSFANNKVGNGGDVIVCKKQGGEIIHLLDFYEEDLNIKIDGEDEFTIAKNVFQKLSVAAPKLWEIFTSRIDTIKNNWKVEGNIKLNNIKDSNHIKIPASDCKLQQIAIRHQITTNDNANFTVDKFLYDKLPPTQRAGLVTHEIIYEYLRKLGESDSVKSRKLNAYLFKENKIESKLFWKFINSLELPIYP